MQNYVLDQRFETNHRKEKQIKQGQEDFLRAFIYQTFYFNGIPMVHGFDKIKYLRD
jgi:hypothetical protein